MGLGQKMFLFCYGRTETGLLELRLAAVREARLKSSAYSTAIAHRWYISVSASALLCPQPHYCPANSISFQDLALKFPALSTSWKVYKEIPGLSRRCWNPDCIPSHYGQLFSTAPLILFFKSRLNLSLFLFSLATAWP